MKIKHRVSSPSFKVWGNFLRKKASHGGKHFFGKIYGGMFYMVTNDHIMLGEKLMTEIFQRSCQVFLSLTMTWVIDILFEKLTPQIGD